MKREDIQQEAVNKMREVNLLILQWCTGLGKSKAAIDIIKDMPDNSNILLVVAELAHKENWKKEFLKWGLPLNTGIVIETYASLKNHRDKSYDLLVLDEAHHVGSDLRMEILEEIKVKKVLALSATLPQEVWFKLAALYGKPMYSSKVTLQDAISYGILPEPKIYLIPMELDNTELNQTIIEEWGKKALRVVRICSLSEKWTYMKNKSKYPNMRLEMPCTELQKYISITNNVEYWKNLFMRNRNEGIKNKWLQLGSERKRYLGELKSKMAQKVIEHITNKRYVCFCSSIKQAELLGGDNSIHSKKKGSLGTIEDFNNKEINNLFAVGMIQEGQNLNDIEVGVIVQLDGQERAFIQKSGRAMRAEEPILIILYYKETRDEEYLKKALEGISSEYVIEVTDLKEIVI